MEGGAGIMSKEVGNDLPILLLLRLSLGPVLAGFESQIWIPLLPKF
jgi:hypothetical protein